jgi:hypothetical protein
LLSNITWYKPRTKERDRESEREREERREKAIDAGRRRVRV